MSDLEEQYAKLYENFVDPLLRPHTPQVRLYLLSESRPPEADLARALADYEIFVPRSPDEIAFIRKIPMESEEQFRAECARVAKILAGLVAADSYIGCSYDDVRGRTTFQFELQKTGDSQEFAESQTTPE
jgi:hypothetical protein